MLRSTAAMSGRRSSSWEGIPIGMGGAAAVIGLTRIEKPDAECMLEIGNHLRDGGLRYAELRCGLGHAPLLDDREEQMQVPQCETAPDLTIRIEFSWHR